MRCSRLYCLGKRANLSKFVRMADYQPEKEDLYLPLKHVQADE